ncbi:ABC transporter permease [Peptoniphilus sp. KCTC 25270]|uniref:ABC transporter permease subunit n=1 Tax=Peptoniphilus sp. KCTC 25270 TaxID=2897414 RepID=UPI001E420AA4|nr:ABC transporter permease subunit [Peptoniphilus sp. KCTC 25270]MCD1147086.1 ABC transporter permease [Peptoniphilus sp. KCTC 25270]
MVFGLEFKSNMGKAITWLFVLIIITGLLMAFFPLMQEDNILSLVEGFRQGFSDNARHMLGLSPEVDYRNLSEYIPFIYQYIGVLFAIFAIQLGAKSLSKEQSAGTIQYLYSQPVSRSKIVSDKWAANLFLYILIALITVLATFGFGFVFSKGNLNVQEVALVLGQVFLYLLGMGILFLFLGTLYSALSNRSSHAEGGSVLIVLILLVAWMVLVILGNQVGNIGMYFPFDAFNPLLNILNGVNIVAIGANIVLAIVFLLLGYVFYNGKELKF